MQKSKEAGGPRALQVRDLCLNVGDKKILHGVSVTARSGEMMAVMGPSGSGKTSLMNLICGRRPADATVGGEILVDGLPVSSRLRKSFGYVTQEDVFFPQLTLRQTLWFYSQVKLPSSLDSAQKQQRVDEVVELLELRKCLQTKLGDVGSRGLSGGEKKRANIACELLRRPRVLLLDEPTSGLDASLALKVAELLGRWSLEMGSIVMASIHQPSSQTFQQFSQLLLLVDGCTAYRGCLRDMPQHFAELGVAFCPDWNAADSMLEAVKESSPHKQQSLAGGSQFTAEPVEGSPRHVNLGFDEGSQQQLESSASSYAVTMPATGCDSVGAARISWAVQFCALCCRGFLVSKDSILSVHVVAQSAAMAFMSCAVWFRLQRTEEALPDHMAAIFFVTSYMVFAPFFDAIMTFYSDLEVVKHERKSGMYRVSAFYMAKMVVEVPLLVAMPLMTLTPIFWAVGLGQFHVYAAFTVIVTVNSLASQGIGITFSLLSKNPRANMTFAFVFMIFSFMTGGFFATKIPAWFNWAKYISYVRYCYHFALVLILENLENFACSTTYPSAYSACAHNGSSITGQEVLQHHPDSILPQWLNVLIAFVLFAGFRLTGYLLLRYWRRV